MHAKPGFVFAVLSLIQQRKDEKLGPNHSDGEDWRNFVRERRVG